MKKFINGIRLYVKMKIEMFVWNLYDKCADYLDRHSLVIRVDSDTLQDMVDEKDELLEKLFVKEEKIYDLEEYINYLECRIDVLEELA